MPNQNLNSNDEKHLVSISSPKKKSKSSPDSSKNNSIVLLAILSKKISMKRKWHLERTMPSSLVMVYHSLVNSMRSVHDRNMVTSPKRSRCVVRLWSRHSSMIAKRLYHTLLRYSMKDSSHERIMK